MRQQSYLNSAKMITGIYDGREPLSGFLKKYFATHKKYGSKDRKQITALCYHLFRLGKALPDSSVEEKIITATFLCEQLANDFLHFHKPEWNELTTRPLAEKISFVGFAVEDVFPWKEELSGGMDLKSFCFSFFTQPHLFLRIRPGQKNIVLKKLKDAGLQYESRDEDCIALPNASKLEGTIETDKEAVVQDLNSQQVLNFLKDQESGIPVRTGLHPGGQHPASAWDCCAASGGKSILAYDIMNGKIELIVSDIRESIISNLKKRFAIAGIKNYKSFIADLSIADSLLPIVNCPLIICDAPCTGSGTWSRTPEQLYFFKKEMIADYAGTQKKIVTNIIPHLKTGGLFIYITCSVFKKENEDMVNFIKEKFHLQVLQMELLKGDDKKADSMFVAVFLKK